MDSSTSVPEIAGMSHIKKLGSGGFADVYLYHREVPSMEVAVKVLRGTVKDSARVQFLKEANFTAQLSSHPNIISIFAVDTTVDGRPYIAMEYHPGQNLFDRCKEARLPVTEVLSLMIKICSAVEYAHNLQIIHSDIKPANILTSTWNVPILTDFGIAGFSNEKSEVEAVSFPWTAPEVINGTSPSTVASDVYSLGATIWTLLASRTPFIRVDERTGRKDPDSEKKFAGRIERLDRSDVPQELERLIESTVSTRIATRPRSAYGLAIELQRIEENLGLTPTIIDRRIVQESSAPIITSFDQDQPANDGTTFKAREINIDPAADNSDRYPNPELKIASPLQIPREGIDDPNSSTTKINRISPNAVKSVNESPRSSPSTPSVPKDLPDSPTGKKNTKVLAAIGGGVAIIAAVAALLITLGLGPSHRTPNSSTASNLSNSASSTVLANSSSAGTLGTPVLTLTQVDSTHFLLSWKYSGQASSDLAKVIATSNGASTATNLSATTEYTITTPAQPTCYTVQVANRNLSEVSSASNSVCVN